MTVKKKILLLTTGGTIASVPGGEGLEPRRAEVMERELEQLRTYYDICVRDVICLDSSNIRPEEWQLIARHIFEDRFGFDGVVVSHGTDTMAYTASAVTYMLPNIDVPVVFTGSQLPLTDMLSDGPDNLRTAFAMAASGCPGVFLAFDRKVMLGCRAVKVRASGFSAFESVNARYAALVSNRGLVADPRVLPRRSGEPRLLCDISKNVFLLKLTPGLNPAVFDMLAAMGYKGIVIEAFGLGGVNVLHRGLRGIRRCVEDGVSVVVTTQCLYDSADLQVYQVGSKLLELGVIQGRDMTSEAAMTKLMWAIGQGMEQEQISEIFRQSLAGEVTI
ncbi:MAG: asparaginase [Faecousia sp.]